MSGNVNKHTNQKGYEMEGKTSRSQSRPSSEVELLEKTL